MKDEREQLQEEYQKIPTFVHELDASMKKLSTCWEGPAWITFQQQVESDILNMLDLYDWYREYLQNHAEVEKIYGDTEKKTYEMVEDIRI